MQTRKYEDRAKNTFCKLVQAQTFWYDKKERAG